MHHFHLKTAFYTRFIQSRNILWLVPLGVCVPTLSGCNNSIANERSAATAPSRKAITTTKPTPKPSPKPKAKTWQTPKIPPWVQGKIIRHVNIKPGEKVFALTFDDGPWPYSTHQILKILRDHEAKATFFMLGQEVRNSPSIAKAIRDQGHAIGSHSWDHPSRPRDAKAQIQRTNQEIQRVLGYEPNLFRPPYGMVKNGLAHEAMRKKMAVVLWSSDSIDWKHPGSAAIVRTVLREASPGGIGLLHDGGGARGQTIAALPVILRTLKARGYRFVTVPELFAMRYVAPKKKTQSKLKAIKSTPTSTQKRPASR